MRLIPGFAICCLVMFCARETAVGGPETTFTYQGVLHEDGAPIDGVRTLRFGITTDPTGVSVSDTTTQSVNVEDGRFTTQLDFGDDIVEAYANVPGDPQWYVLVEVQEPDMTFTKLLPPQPLSAAPFSTNTRGIDIDVEGNAFMDRSLVVGNIEDDPTITTTTGLNLDLEDGDGTQNLLAVAIPDSSEGGDGDAFSVFARLRPDFGGRVGLLEFRDEADSILARIGGRLIGSNDDIPHGYLSLFGEPGTLGGRIELFRDGSRMIPSVDIVAGGHTSPWPSANIRGPGGMNLLLNMNQTGDDLLRIPPGAINSVETANEPGIAAVINHNEIEVDGPNQLTTVLAVESIDCPGPGYVVALGSCQYVPGLGNDDLLFQRSSFYITTPDLVGSTGQTGLTRSRCFEAQGPAIMIQSIVEVTDAGLVTLAFWRNGSEIGQNAFLRDRRLTLLYFPTAYGSANVDQVFTPPAPPPPEDDPRRSAELAAYRAEIQELRERIERLEGGED